MQRVTVILCCSLMGCATTHAPPIPPNFKAGCCEEYVFDFSRAHHEIGEVVVRFRVKLLKNPAQGWDWTDESIVIDEAKSVPYPNLRAAARHMTFDLQYELGRRRKVRGTFTASFIFEMRPNCGQLSHSPGAHYNLNVCSSAWRTDVVYLRP